MAALCRVANKHTKEDVAELRGALDHIAAEKVISQIYALRKVGYVLPAVNCKVPCPKVTRMCAYTIRSDVSGIGTAVYNPRLA